MCRKITADPAQHTINKSCYSNFIASSEHNKYRLDCFFSELSAADFGVASMFSRSLISRWDGHHGK